eukprot:TRINITY_DN103270_c0_g1_i1.p1 TRINITY_DN103270_c0_g1~~TRINITY_DN103270_c0_g1_i1.p1  ORF type:complete len:412 (+),score=62.93 TRINITY_DN103270_c0_g1_i1:113-1237(+)
MRDAGPSVTGSSAEDYSPEDWKGLPPGTRIPKGFESWTDYTRYALECIRVHGPVGPSSDSAKQKEFRPSSLVDRKRSLGIDFGPSFTGLALSLGGVNTMAMGTLKTGEDWKDLSVTIAQVVSTRRVKDIVVGQPLERDGTEGKIGRLVRHFSQVLADAVLLLLGTDVSVYLWDERFSTVYAATRLTTRPRFDGAVFKTWLDGQRGLNFGAKALLDAEAARAILEHWLTKDEVTETINKERSERVSPSREACKAYLKYRKVRAHLPPTQPTEPAGPGAEGWQWMDAHPGSYELDADEFEEKEQAYREIMEGMDRFGDVEYEREKRMKKIQAEREIRKRIKETNDDSSFKEALRSAAEGGGDSSMPRLPEKWKRFR